MTTPLWVAFDTETTGLEAGSRMVELAGVAFTLDGDIVDRFEKLVHPEMPVPADVTQIHGLSDEHLCDAEPAGAVLREFLNWLPNDATLVAHNASYDLNILHWELDRNALELPKNRVVDSGRLARALGETRNVRLQTLVRYHRWTLPGDAHRAAVDADAVRQLVLHVLNRKLHLTRPDLFVGSAFFGSWRYPPEIPAVLSPVETAIAEGRRLWLIYRDATGRESERWVTPYGLAIVQEQLRFHGWCHSRRARRNFLANRIIRLDQSPTS